MGRQDAQVRYSALTFRMLLDALARPGKIIQLAVPQLQNNPAQITAGNINSFALGALLTLLDRETSFILASQAHWLETSHPWTQWIMLRSGSPAAPAEQADFALICDQQSQILLTQLHRGTLLAPESSATALYCLEQITHELTAEVEDGWIIELRGPGIADVQSVKVRGVSEAALTDLVITRRGYPLGIDVFFIDDAGRCIGLPRTTRLTWTRALATQQGRTYDLKI